MLIIYAIYTAKPTLVAAFYSLFSIAVDGKMAASFSPLKTKVVIVYVTP